MNSDDSIFHQLNRMFLADFPIGDIIRKGEEYGENRKDGDGDRYWFLRDERQSKFLNILFPPSQSHGQSSSSSSSSLLSSSSSSSSSTPTNHLFPFSLKKKHTLIKTIQRLCDRNCIDLGEEFIDIKMNLLMTMENGSSSSEEYYYKTYDLSPSLNDCIHIRVFSSFHTLGLREWEASHLFIEYLFQSNKFLEENIVGENILELGAGVGLVSIVLHRLKARKVWASEYPDVKIIENLRENVDIERRKDIKKKNNEEETLSCSSLDWGNCENNETIEAIERFNPTRIVAADCVYSPEGAELLASCISTIFQANNGNTCEKAYICSAVRNENTFNHFQKACESNGINWKSSTKIIIDSISGSEEFLKYNYFPTPKEGFHYRLIELKNEKGKK